MPPSTMVTASDPMVNTTSMMPKNDDFAEASDALMNQ